MAADCGGCRGEGSHRRWCVEKVGLAASQWGPIAETLESLGDRIGPNDFAAANHCYAAAGLMLQKARKAAETMASV